MINEKDVIRMKIPFPSISDRLAVCSHMYICRESAHPNYGFVKCQTLKPYMLGSSLFYHYVDEAADAARNPFAHTTRIDCDKLFITSSILYDDSMKTTIRTDVCQELYDLVKMELAADGCQTFSLNEDEMVSINPPIQKIPVVQASTPV